MKFDARKPKGPLAILGNGPSLRSVDFGSLSDFDTLGMNAAYRYWDRIEWRPTHYVCLDDALIETHIKPIRGLIEEDRIESFFLTARVLQLEPDLADFPNISYIDQFVPHWHKVRGGSLGLEYIESDAFKTAKPNMLTTGAYATRYGAWMNYRTLVLLGMDLAYHPLPEAEEKDDLRLEIRETPKHNPNYFFDDYQRQGDIYHIPNPRQSSVDLHFQSFVSLMEDFQQAQVPVRVINASEPSRLRDIDGIPYHSLTDLQPEVALGQVLVPFAAHEVDRILDNFWLWSLPSFRPSIGETGDNKPNLIFVANNDDAFGMRHQIQTAFENSITVRSSFSSIRFTNLELSGDADFYQRSNSGKAPAKGRRAGPNNLFFGAMEFVKHFLGGSLLLETDCVPIRDGWLDKAKDILRSDSLSWVIGSIYFGDEKLAARDKRHINGNALYATSDPAFQTYLDTVWRDGLREAVKNRPELPFDCFFEHMMDHSDSMDTSDDSLWTKVRRFQHRFRYHPYILNYAGSTPSGDALSERIAEDLLEWGEAHIVHSKHLSRAVHALRSEFGSSSLQPGLNELLNRLTPNTTSAASSDSSNPQHALYSARLLVRKTKQRLLKRR